MTDKLTLKQIFAGCSVLCCLLIAAESRAVDVGDVFYSDGSCRNFSGQQTCALFGAF